jgi:hypothetical protein
MKNIYPWTIKVIIIISAMITLKNHLAAQCQGGYVPGAVAYDTTVSTGSGNYSTEFKFPKFQPDSGLLTCVRLCITITGRVSMLLENNVNSPATYNIIYSRNDTLVGPGLTPSLTNNVTTGYGPYDLAASDGVSFSGPDFVSIGPDTVLNAVTQCRLLTDSMDLLPFYGPSTDSVSYLYTIHAGAVVTGSGDYLFSIATQGSVRYQLQYCFCPSFTLPLGIYHFSLNKLAPDRVQLNWNGFDDPNTNYHYVAEMSGENMHFSDIASFAKNISSDSYRYLYTTHQNETGKFFFRVKQVYSNGYTRFTEIKSVDLESSARPLINIYPNPSKGIVGIKFDNISTGKFIIQIYREMEVSGNSYRQITSLHQGTYWMKITDVTSHLSCVNQLLIK